MILIAILSADRVPEWDPIPTSRNANGASNAFDSQPFASQENLHSHVPSTQLHRHHDVSENQASELAQSPVYNQRHQQALQQSPLHNSNHFSTSMQVPESNVPNHGGIGDAAVSMEVEVNTCSDYNHHNDGHASEHYERRHARVHEHGVVAGVATIGIAESRLEHSEDGMSMDISITDQQHHRSDLFHQQPQQLQRQYLLAHVSGQDGESGVGGPCGGGAGSDRGRDDGMEEDIRQLGGRHQDHDANDHQSRHQLQENDYRDPSIQGRHVEHENHQVAQQQWDPASLLFWTTRLLIVSSELEQNIAAQAVRFK
jgi:hypothetical protein